MKICKQNYLLQAKLLCKARYCKRKNTTKTPKIPKLQKTATTIGKVKPQVENPGEVPFSSRNESNHAVHQTAK